MAAAAAGVAAEGDARGAQCTGALGVSHSWDFLGFLGIYGFMVSFGKTGGNWRFSELEAQCF